MGALLMIGIIAACNSGDASAGAQSSSAAPDSGYQGLENPLPLNIRPKVITVDGHSHTVSVRSDGTVWVWGVGRDGELGLEKKVDSRSQPVQIPGLSDVVEVAGGSHTLALLKDGTVWSWGRNTHGQLGYETKTGFSASPKKIPNLTNAVSIAAGNMHSLVLRGDGSVYAFGSNERLQIGSKNSRKRFGGIPDVVMRIESAAKVVSSGDTCAVLTSSGKVIAWGVDESRQFSSRDDKYAMTPRDIPVPQAIADFVVGVNNYYVLGVDGSVWAIGSNSNGALGQGDWRERAGWQRVRGLPRIAGLSSSSLSAIAIDVGGVVRQWGENVRWKPQLSARKSSMENTPVVIPGVYPGATIYSGMRNVILSGSGGVHFWGWDNGARGRSPEQKPLRGDDSWFVPETSVWTWK